MVKILLEIFTFHYKILYNFEHDFCYHRKRGHNKYFIQRSKKFLQIKRLSPDKSN